MVQISDAITMLSYALSYAAKGWHVLPVRKNKSPFTLHGKDDATTDEIVIRKWWSKYPTAGIAISCKESGLLVIDIDNKNGKQGEIVWTNILKDEGLFGNINYGLEQITPNGGRHLFFRHPDFMVSSRVDGLGDGIDIRSEAYVVIAPTEGYHWVEGRDPESTEIFDVPQWLAERLPEKVEPITGELMASPVFRTADDWTDIAISKASIGNRNETCFWLAVQLRDSGVVRDESDPFIMRYTEEVEQIDSDRFELEEALTTRDSAYGRPAREIALMTNESANISDAANGRRFARMHNLTATFVKGRGWLIWSGKRWEDDALLEIDRMTVETALAIYTEAAGSNDPEYAKALGNWARQSLSKSRMGFMLETARHLLAARIDDFDADPMSINLQNGYMNLISQLLTPHSPAQMITKIANTEYDSEAGCPEWLKFLDRIFADDKDLIQYVQKALGYSLTGKVSEQCFFFLYGTGANGKTTFINVIREILGDYAIQAAPDLLLQGERHPTEVAALLAARVVATVEVEAGRKFAEVLVKQLTGGDKISARKMRQDFFEFMPTFKLWLVANHKPIVQGVDEAIWRRIKLIPFSVTIPENERDPDLVDKLLREREGILTWMIEGCRKWQETGLTAPARVVAGTEGYREEMDVIGDFLADCCDIGGDYSVGAQELSSVYQAWCRDRGERSWYVKRFNGVLEHKGFVHKRDMKGVGWYGLKLKAEFTGSGYIRT